jgi:hypothetical protein
MRLLLLIVIALATLFVCGLIFADPAPASPTAAPSAQPQRRPR